MIHIESCLRLLHPESPAGSALSEVFSKGHRHGSEQQPRIDTQEPVLSGVAVAR